MLSAPEPSAEAPAYDVAHDPKAMRARIRADLHLLVKALAERDYAEASSLVRGGENGWSEERFEQALAPFYAEHERLVFDQSARYTDKTETSELAPAHYRVRQILVDDSGENHWYLEAEVDVREGLAADQPLLKLLEVAG
jgi:hypothetical protein